MRRFIILIIITHPNIQDGAYTRKSMGEIALTYRLVLIQVQCILQLYKLGLVLGLTHKFLAI